MRYRELAPLLDRLTGIRHRRVYAPRDFLRSMARLNDGVGIAVYLSRLSSLLVPHIADPFEEQKRKYVGLPVGPVDGAPAGQLWLKNAEGKFVIRVESILSSAS
jgi:hypothetical protein